MFSRQLVGFTDFTEEERARFAPVRQRLVREHTGTGRKSLYLSSHAGLIDGLSIPEARLLLRDFNKSSGYLKSEISILSPNNFLA